MGTATSSSFSIKTTRRRFAQLEKVESLDLTVLDLSAVTDVREMFAESATLQRIYVSDHISVTNCTTAMTVDMFSGCEKLAGDMGTSYALRKPIRVRLGSPSKSQRPPLKVSSRNLWYNSEKGAWNKSEKIESKEYRYG